MAVIKNLLVGLLALAASTPVRAETRGFEGQMIEVGVAAQSLQNLGPRMVIQVGREGYSGPVRLWAIQLQAKIGRLPGKDAALDVLSGYQVDVSPITLSTTGYENYADREISALSWTGLSVALLPTSMQRELAIGVQNKLKIRVIGIAGQKVFGPAAQDGHFGLAATLGLQLLGYQYLASEEMLGANTPFKGFEVGTARGELRALWNAGSNPSGGLELRQFSVGVRFESDLAIGKAGQRGLLAAAVKGAARVSLDIAAFGATNELYVEASSLRQYFSAAEFSSAGALPLIFEAGLVSRF